MNSQWEVGKVAKLCLATLCCPIVSDRVLTTTQIKMRLKY